VRDLTTRPTARQNLTEPRPLRANARGLPWLVLPKKRWPALQFKEKRAITPDEHRKILAAESNLVLRGVPTRSTILYLLGQHGPAVYTIPNFLFPSASLTIQIAQRVRKKCGTKRPAPEGISSWFLNFKLPCSSPACPDNPNRSGLPRGS
jgi:hypothetical protein